MTHEQDDDLDAIIDNLGARQLHHNAWDSWPEKARRFVARVCERNDAGTSDASVRQTVDALKETFGVVASARTVERYVTQQLGRRTWRQK
jgi:hypothetical protein